MNLDITENIKELASPLAEEKGLFLVDVEYKTGSGNEVWIYLDGEDRGVNLDECADISRELGVLIEAHELLENKYRLNVSSPGLARPLSDIRQYKKNIGRTLKIRFRNEQEVLRKQGIILSVTEATILVDEKEGNEIEIPFESIIEAKIIPVIN